jgi:hypothetical protein
MRIRINKYIEYLMEKEIKLELELDLIIRLLQNYVILKKLINLWKWRKRNLDQIRAIAFNDFLLTILVVIFYYFTTDIYFISQYFNYDIFLNK